MSQKQTLFPTHADESVPPEPYDKKHVDMHIFKMLQKNFDLVSMIADIDKPDAISLRTEGQTRQSTPLLKQRRRSRSVEPLTDIRRKRSQSIAVPKLMLSGVELANAPSYSKFGTHFSDPFLQCLDQMPTKQSWNLGSDFKYFYSNVLAAFTETNDDLRIQRPTSPTRLSASTLKRDIGRCLSESHSYFESVAGIHDLLIWKNPIASLAIFSVYMYCVYKGWLANLVLGLVLLQLIFNYLATQKKIDLGLQFMPRKQLPVMKFELSGIQLVFDVARRVQVLLTILADLIEKIKNLFMWERPEVTFKFFMLVLFFFVNSVVFSSNAYFTGIGFLIGGRAFVTNYLYHRFPKAQKLFDVFMYRELFRARFYLVYSNKGSWAVKVFVDQDVRTNFRSTLYFWDRVPNELQKTKILGMPIKKSGSTPHLRKEISAPIGSCDRLEVLKKDHELNQTGNSTFYMPELRRRSVGFVPLPFSHPNSPVVQRHQTLSPYSSSGNTFLDSKSDQGFYLDSDKSERPENSEEISLDISHSLTSDSGSYEENIRISRPCFFVDKEKVFGGEMIEGIITLGDNKLSFNEKSSYSSSFNYGTLNFPFNEISKIKKIKLSRTLYFFSGKSKGIEIYLNYQIKPLQFVGIAKRDEFYEIAIETARVAGFCIEHGEQ